VPVNKTDTRMNERVVYVSFNTLLGYIGTTTSEVLTLARRDERS